MWFIFALITTFSWGCSDLFYKKGSDSDDKLSHLKIVVIVGLVMGIHGIIYMYINNLSLDIFNLIKYLPVSFLYILSMAIGYIGLRYIELSVSSPIQNTSGAVSAMLCFIFFEHILGVLDILGIIIVTSGVIALAVIEKKLESNLVEDKKYKLGFLAIIFPILYCIIDGLGTFADAIYLDEFSIMSEENALLAYEFTFFICALIVYFYIKVVKKEKFCILMEKDKISAAVFETLGQFFYVFAMAKNAIIVAPLIASYSIVSVILSRIFLKEKLVKSQYFVIGYVMLGIILLGISGD